MEYQFFGSQILMSGKAISEQAKILGDRIRERLKALGVGNPAIPNDEGQSWLARETNMTQKGISAIINGRVERPRMLHEIAIKLKTSPEYLLGRTNDPSHRLSIESPHPVHVPLISWVAAGNPTTPEAVHEFEDAKRLVFTDLDPNGDWIALSVDGSSMDRISPPDSIILVNRKSRRLVPNACYVIADSETGETSYKRYRPDPTRFEPVSTEMAKHKKSTVFGSPRIIGRVKRSYIDM